MLIVWWRTHHQTKIQILILYVSLAVNDKWRSYLFFAAVLALILGLKFFSRRVVACFFELAVLYCLGGLLSLISPRFLKEYFIRQIGPFDPYSLLLKGLKLFLHS